MAVDEAAEDVGDIGLVTWCAQVDRGSSRSAPIEALASRNDLLVRMGDTSKGIARVSFVLPNFYFRATTAYAILRHCSLPIGKRDFLGSR